MAIIDENVMVGDREYFGFTPDPMRCAVVPKIEGYSWCKQKTDYITKEQCVGCSYQQFPKDGKKMCNHEIVY